MWAMRKRDERCIASSSFSCISPSMLNRWTFLSGSKIHRSISKSACSTACIRTHLFFEIEVRLRFGSRWIFFHVHYNNTLRSFLALPTFKRNQVLVFRWNWRHVRRLSRMIYRPSYSIPNSTRWSFHWKSKWPIRSVPFHSVSVRS